MLILNKRELGSFGENEAAKFLEELGFTIVERSFRFSRMGEIDIIAREKNTFCFIEVKSRTSTSFGTPAEAVGYRKQANIRKIAQIYLNMKKLYNEPVRFDVVEVYLNSNKSGVDKINLIRNAF